MFHFHHMTKVLRLLFLIPFLTLACRLFAQSPSFVVSAEVCLNESIDIQNTSNEFNSFEWDFCVGELENIPFIANSYSDPSFSTPVGVSVIKESGIYYGLVCSRDNKTIYLLEFGERLSNPPFLINQYTSHSFTSPEWIKMVKENNTWIGFVANYTSNNIARLHFSNGITAAPAVEDLGNFGGELSYPRGLELKIDKSQRYLFISNTSENQILRIKFTDSWLGSLKEAEVSIVGENSGIVNPFGISLIKSSETWYGLVSSYTNHKYFLLNFGSDLSSVPTIREVGTASAPIEIKWVEEAGEYYGFGTGGNGNFYRIKFGENLGEGGVIEDLGNFSGTLSNAFGFDMVQDGSNWHAFSMNYSTKELSRIDFKNTCNANIPYAVIFEPKGVSFGSPGEKVIALKAFNSNGEIFTQRGIITVTENQAPVVDFNLESTICVLDPINLQVEKAAPEIIIMNYLWTLPDGSQQTGEEVNYIFEVAGTYKVRLDVESEEGCRNFLIKEITVYPEPHPDYSLSTNLACTNTGITFTNETNFPEESVISYSWDFGDGSTSTDKNPEHVFSTAGTYTVMLSAIIPGCTSTSTQIIEVKAGPHTLFDAEPVCAEQKVVFHNLTSGVGISGYEWDLGDGTFSTLENPEHVYDSAGTYLVLLKTANSIGCETSHTQSVHVYSLPEPDFTLGPSCAKNEIQFTDATTDKDGNIEAWHWRFEQPDGTLLLKEEQNPVVSFPQPGSYEVVLTTTTTWLCKQTVRKTIVVDPVPELAIGLEGGCLGIPSILADVSEPGALKVQSWYWRIGEEVFTDSAFSYTFPAAGTYEVFLQLNLENGCSVSDIVQIVIDPLPQIDFSWSGTCSGQPAVFQSTFIASTYEWTLDGQLISTSASFDHTFEAIGTHSLQLSVLNEKGCFNTISKEIEIVPAPVAVFSADRAKGLAPFTVQFTNSSQGGVAYRWFFDDAQQSSSTRESPSFTFGETREYEVKLVAYNAAGCTDTTVQFISVVEGKYDVGLSAINLLRQKGQVQLVLGLENAGTIAITNVEISVLVNNEYALSEMFEGNIEMGEQENYSLNMQLLENSKRKLRFICVELKPHLNLVSEEISVTNNKLCLSFDNSFVMHEPYPNPGQDKVTLEYLLPQAGTLNVWVYSAEGKLVQQTELKNQKAGLNQYEVLMEGMGKGIYFIKARFGGEEVSYRIMKH